MAYLIECDRCGETEKAKSTSDMPARWLQFNELHRGNGETATKPIPGGVFCPSCTKELEKWREPVARPMPMDAEAFRKMSHTGI